MKYIVLLFLVCTTSSALPINSLARLYAKLHPNTRTEPDSEYGNLWQGDIELEDSFGSVGEPDLLNAMWDLNKRWPNNVVYYTLKSGEYTSDQVSRIDAAIRDLVEITRVNGQQCIDIRQRSSESNYVFVEKFSGCTSYVGMIGGSQRMSLEDGCVTSHGTIMHEFLHALGFHHEHMRADRDDYVYINEDNIMEGLGYAFEKLVEGSTVDHVGTGYDYGSVMHYGAYAFADDTSIPTIIPHDPNAEIGQRSRLSDLDIERVQIFYCCLAPLDSKYHKHLAKVMRDYC